MARDVAAIRAGLTALARHNMPDAADFALEGLERAGSGNSSENWFFDARWRSGGHEERHSLVLRRTPANEIVRNSREDEFLLLKALNGTGLPVPRVYWIDRNGEWLNRPAVVLARCPGSDDRALLSTRGKAGLDEDRRVSIAADMVDLLARIHRLNPAELDLPPSLLRGAGPPARAELDKQQAAALADETIPSIELRAAAWWLRDNLPDPPSRAVLVHGDFRPANLLVDKGHVTALLDWEFAHVGDPAEDLGWYLAPRYRGEHFIAGRWDPEDFLGAYEQASGVRVDRAAVRWWGIFAQYKLCAMVLAAQKAFSNGDASRMPAPAGAMLWELLEAVRAEEGRRP
jgi:aminoglycoside phosphotransferase (APT) family kinase protein